MTITQFTAFEHVLANEAPLPLHKRSFDQSHRMPIDSLLIYLGIQRYILLNVPVNSTLATKAYVNVPMSQPHHLTYDNAAYGSSDISSACHPPYLYEGFMTSNKTFIAGKDQVVVQKLDGLIPPSMTSMLLASTPPILPWWSWSDPSGRPFLMYCRRSNPSQVSKPKELCRNASSVNCYDTQFKIRIF